MELSWHPVKREKTLAERDIDFAGLLMAFSDPKRLIARTRAKITGRHASTCWP
jgi:uncharacterized DUF497 family protein